MVDEEMEVDGLYIKCYYPACERGRVIWWECQYQMKKGLHTARGPSGGEREGSYNAVLQLEQAENHPQVLLKQIAGCLPQHS